MIGQEIHSDFKISSEGEALSLRNQVGELIDHIGPIHLHEDVSFGRLKDGEEILSEQYHPTPGQSNARSGTIHCSHFSGHYPGGVNISLTASADNASIHYTTNGEIPTPEDPVYRLPLRLNHGTEPVRISNIPLTPLAGPDQLCDFIWKAPKSVYKVNVLRFASFFGDSMVGGVNTRTFFLDPDFSNRYTLPVVSIVTDSLSLFDHDTGIMVPGATFDELGFDWFPAGNYNHDGENWERIADLEYFIDRDKSLFKRQAGIAIRGNSSSNYPQKSFNVYFRSENRAKAVEYNLFSAPGPNKFKRLALYNGGSDFLRAKIRDVVIHNLIEPLNLESQRSNGIILFINGEYWGVYHVRDKMDKFHFKYQYNVNEDSLTVVSPCSGIGNGEPDTYYEMERFLEENDISLSANLDSISKILDIQNLINYQIAEIYSGNYDWPAANQKFWKSDNSKWRAITYDLDRTLGWDDKQVSYPSIAYSLRVDEAWHRPSCANRLFRLLLDNGTFQNQFIESFAYHLNNTFNSENVIAHIDASVAEIRSEMPEHIDRWGYPSSMWEWNEEVEIMREFARLRPCYMKQHIIDYFNLDTLDVDCNPSSDHTELTIYPNPSSLPTVTLNFVHTNSSRWNLSIFAINGQLINTRRIEGTTFTLNVGDLNSGMYVLKAESEHETLMSKLVVAR